MLGVLAVLYFIQAVRFARVAKSLRVSQSAGEGAGAPQKQLSYQQPSHQQPSNPLKATAAAS
jgi:hypothetical protein